MDKNQLKQLRKELEEARAQANSLRATIGAMIDRIGLEEPEVAKQTDCNCGKGGSGVYTDWSSLRRG